MHQRKLAAKPQAKYTPPVKKVYKYKNQSDIDSCPVCGGIKIKSSRQCRGCWNVSKRPPVDNNIYIVEGVRCRKMPLWGGKYTTVNASDYRNSMQWLWHEMKSPLSQTSYVQSFQDKKYVWLHRMLLGITDPNIEVDHKNYNGLDNRRKNLRVATHMQNMSNGRKRINNKSGYIGVSWFAPTSVWRSYIVVGYKQIHLGYFESAVDAAKVRDAAAGKYHGDFASLNFPNDVCENLPRRLHRKTGKK